jgi:hypothetical protein
MPDDEVKSAALFPGSEGQPGMDPGDEQTESEPLDLGDGRDKVISQQNVGPGSELGGGEFPDRDTAAQRPAPGAGSAVASDPDAPGTSVLDEEKPAVEPNEPA